MRKVRLGDICDVLNGYAFKSSNYVLDGIRIIRITNVQKGYIADDDPKYYPIEAQDTLKKYMLNQDDLLISLTGNVGRVGLLPKLLLPAALNQRVACLRLKNSGVEIDRKYLFHALNSDIFENACIYSSNGIAQKNLSTEWLKDYYIPLYSVKKQKIIVEKLDLIIRLINLRTLQLQKLDELVKSRFIEMFGNPIRNEKGWEKFSIGKRCKIITGNTPSRKNNANYGNYIEWIKSDNINTPYTYLTKAQESLSETGFDKCRFVEAGSLLMTCIAGSISCIGNVAITDRRVAFNQQINAIVPGKDDNVFFLYWLILLSKSAIHNMINMSLKGILSKSKLCEMEFIFPPIELQNEFADFVKSTDKLKIAIQKSLDELETLKKSLMQQYFG